MFSTLKTSWTLFLSHFIHVLRRGMRCFLIAIGTWCHFRQVSVICHLEPTSTEREREGRGGGMQGLCVISVRVHDMKQSSDLTGNDGPFKFFSLTEVTVKYSSEMSPYCSRTSILGLFAPACLVASCFHPPGCCHTFLWHVKSWSFLWVLFFFV